MCWKVEWFLNSFFLYSIKKSFQAHVGFNNHIRNSECVHWNWAILIPNNTDMMSSIQYTQLAVGPNNLHVIIYICSLLIANGLVFQSGQASCNQTSTTLSPLTGSATATQVTGRWISSPVSFAGKMLFCVTSVKDATVSCWFPFSNPIWKSRI